MTDKPRTNPEPHAAEFAVAQQCEWGRKHCRPWCITHDAALLCPGPAVAGDEKAQSFDEWWEEVFPNLGALSERGHQVKETARAAWHTALIVAPVPTRETVEQAIQRAWAERANEEREPIAVAADAVLALLSAHGENRQ